MRWVLLVPPAISVRGNGQRPAAARLKHATDTRCPIPNALRVEPVPNLSAATLGDPRWRTKCIRNCQSTEKQKYVTYIWYGLTAPTGNNGGS
jgi:hypothetical protein